MRNGFKALGLAFVVALALMAFGATSASAQEYLLLKEGETTGQKFSEEKFEEKALVEVTASGSQEGAGRLVVPGRGIIIGCESGTVSEGKITATVAHAKLTFSGCTVWILKKEEGTHKYALGNPSPCHVTGLEITANAKIKPVLHGGETYLLAEPLTTGQPFSSFTFLSGTGCPLPLATTVSGSTVALITQTQAKVQKLTLSPAIQLLLGHKLLYGAFESYIEATGTASVTGPGIYKDAALGAH